MRWLYRIRCWWRYYHCDTPTIGKFRYDVSGMCCYCGKVGDGLNRQDDEYLITQQRRTYLAEAKTLTQDKRPQITITVAGDTGSGKSAIAGEIEIALKAIGVPVVWKDADRENWRHGNEYWIDLYKPEVTIVEQNIPNVAKAPLFGPMDRKPF